MGIIQGLIASLSPNNIVCVGDFNTDLSRIHSTQTTARQQICCGNNLVSAHVCSNSANYTFTSSISNSRSIIDHFIISDSLSEHINKHSTIDDVDNMSDHNPLYLQLSLPITIEHIEDTRQFEPKPKWHAVSPTMLETYKHRLNELLLLIDIPTHRCIEHKNVIDQFHDDIIKCLLIAAKDSIPFTSPYTFQSKSFPGVASAFSDHYNDLFNYVNYNIEDMDNLYEKVCKDSLYCSDHKHAITLSDIDNAMKK